MNLRGRDVLLIAHLRGVKQLRWRASDGQGGFCAMGLLLDSVKCPHLCRPNDWFEDEQHHAEHHRCLRRAASKYAITYDEWELINQANHERGFDFLTIAWMVSPHEELQRDRQDHQR